MATAIVKDTESEPFLLSNFDQTEVRKRRKDTLRIKFLKSWRLILVHISLMSLYTMAFLASKDTIFIGHRRDSDSYGRFIANLELGLI